MNGDRALGLGLIGCGGFGEFCLESFARMDQVRMVAAADVRRDAADKVAGTFGIPAHYDPAELIAREDVDIVHIATPPSTHYQLVMACLEAGKHCLCEKPLATEPDHADQILAAAAQRGLTVPVNFVLRYNAITEAVKAVIDSGVLGAPLSARLTNCASDSPLGPEHWFWDKQVSGGIFIEHGVHFFDLYNYWLGPGRVVSAHSETRQPEGLEDRVTCQVRHDGGAIASHYHGFDQVLPMDRADHRIVFEMGDVRVEGWIPLTATVDAVVDDEGLKTLAQTMPGCRVEVTAEFDESSREVTGRGRLRHVTRRVSVSYTPEADKQKVYADSVRRLLADQIAFIHDGKHHRTITERNGRDSLMLAWAAVKLAEGQSG